MVRHLLVLVVRADRALRDTGAFGDLVHARLAVAVLDEQLGGSLGNPELLAVAGVGRVLLA